MGQPGKVVVLVNKVLHGHPFNTNMTNSPVTYNSVNIIDRKTLLVTKNVTIVLFLLNYKFKYLYLFMLFNPKNVSSNTSRIKNVQV